MLQNSPVDEFHVLLYLVRLPNQSLGPISKIQTNLKIFKLARWLDQFQTI